MLARAVTLSTLAAYVAAQSLSPQCTSALSGIATSPDAAACLSPGALVSAFIGASNDTSIVGPINNWLTGLCGSPACSNETLAAIVTNATTGCATELSVLGFNAAEAGAREQITVAVQTYYPTVRKVVCLKDGDTNCITQTLKNLEGIIGPLSVNNLIQVVGKGFDFAAIPKNMTCTNCIKEAYNVVKQDLPPMLGDAATSTAIQGQCGADFTDGKTPSGISQSATTKTETTQDSGSLSLASSFMSASALLMISGAFAVLA